MVRHAKRTRSITAVAVAVIGPLLAMGAYGIFRFRGWPPPYDALLMLGVLVPVGVVGSWLWERHRERTSHDMGLLRDLPEELQETIGQRATRTLRSFALLVAPMIAVPTLVYLGLPTLVVGAVTLGPVMVIQALQRPFNLRRRWLAMRDVGRIPICGGCGYQLQSLEQICSECGWQDDGRRSSAARPWKCVLVLAVMVMLANVLFWIAVFPLGSKRAEAAAASKVADVLAPAGVKTLFNRVSASVDVPYGRWRSRVVHGSVMSLNGRIRWVVLVDAEMQPVAWHIGNRVASHEAHLIPGRCLRCERIDLDDVGRGVGFCVRCADRARRDRVGER